MLGIYESSVKKISFETGMKQPDVINALESFERVGKVKRVGNYIILVNYMKHQNYNTNMKKSAIDSYNTLPNELKIKGLDIGKDNPSEGFERLSNAFGMVSKIEVEYEVEYENELEEEYKSGIVIFPKIEFSEFWDLYDKKVDRVKSEKKWKSLKDLDRQNILQHLPEYIKATPDKSFRKNPLTYLNARTWEDEELPTVPKKEKSFDKKESMLEKLAQIK